jgi:hypothetical protein
MTCLIGFAAMAIDVGYMYSVKAELQRTADAAALAGAGVMFGEEGLDELVVNATAESYIAKNEHVEPTDTEIQIGEWIEGEFYETYDPVRSNAVGVRVERRIRLFFAPILGVSATTIHAEAIATRYWLASACGAPVGLRTPGFGPVDYDITEQNPGKDGPSYPSNNRNFEIGEEVLVYAFGKGPRPPVHLVADLPQFNGVAETNNILGGKSNECGWMNIGDEIPIWNNGTGDGNFGEKLLDRLQDSDPGNDTIIVPVFEALHDSHDARGKLSGNVKVVDFVGVKLDRVEGADVPNPKDTTKFLKIKLLIGKVTSVMSQGSPNDYPSGVSYTVSGIRMVK